MPSVQNSRISDDILAGPAERHAARLHPASLSGWVAGWPSRRATRCLVDVHNDEGILCARVGDVGKPAHDRDRNVLNLALLRAPTNGHSLVQERRRYTRHGPRDSPRRSLKRFIAPTCVRGTTNQSRGRALAESVS
jgi:hypothetical protein